MILILSEVKWVYGWAMDVCEAVVCRPSDDESDRFLGIGVTLPSGAEVQLMVGPNQSRLQANQKKGR